MNATSTHGPCDGGTCQRHHPIGLDQHVMAKRFLNEFVSLSVAPLLLEAVGWGGDPVKEITESWAMWRAIRRWAKHRGWSFGDSRMRAVVVGDGASPRTGAVIACMSRWQVFSVDPSAKRPGPHKHIDRLTVRAEKIEDCADLVGWADVVVAVHSHAPVDATMAVAKPGGFVFSLPCCVPWPAHDGQERWVDDGVLSPDRTVVVERVPA